MKDFDENGAAYPHAEDGGTPQLTTGNVPDARQAGQPFPETRECEGCGQQKPIEEMSTVFLPGTGETFQCEACRGGP